MTIDVVVPVYATTEHLEGLALDSIARLRAVSKSVRVIVVDNGWPVDRHFGADEYVRLDENQGYAGGTNVGVRLAKSDPLVVSSLDVFVPEGWERIVEVAAERNGVATPSAERFRNGLPTGEFEVPECDYWGGIMAFPRALYDALGGLDEVDFPLRHSDTDFAIRAAKRGYWVGRVPEIVVEHRDPSLSTLLMGKEEVDAEWDRLHEVHGPFPEYAWKATVFG